MASAKGILPRGVSLVLSALLVAAPVSQVSADEAATAPTAALAVASEPAGANVYVDGQLVGATPLNVERLAAGDHRVRVVKNGYLENGRIISVTPGKTNSVAVKLTPAENAAAQVITGSTGGGGGGSKKWLWLGLAGGGAAAAAVVLMNRNKPPIPGTISVSPTGTGMAGQTSFTFTSQGASDPNGDPLTYSWNFGDGGSGSGSSATHTFTTTGTFNVGLTVSDGKEDVSAPGASVTVAQSLAGAWSGGREPTFNCGITATLTQSGTTVGGSMTFTSGCSGTIGLQTASASSPLVHPNTVTWQTQSFNFTVGSTVYPGLNIRFSGPTNAAGTSMSGTITVSQPASGYSASASTSFSR